MKVDESKLQAHLWTFRQPINLEHLKRVLHSNKIKIPVLDAFLQAVSSISKLDIDNFLYISSPWLTPQEPSLRATQYLPDIVKLQHFLFNMYNKQLEMEKAETCTISDFLIEVKKKFNGRFLLDSDYMVINDL